MHVVSEGELPAVDAVLGEGEITSSHKKGRDCLVGRAIILH